MKKLFFIFAAMIGMIIPNTCRAEEVTIPVYMAYTGNNITITNGWYTSIILKDSDENEVFTFYKYGDYINSALSINYTYPTGSHAIQIGQCTIDTEETYHLYFVCSGFFQFQTGPYPYYACYTKGFGVYFTSCYGSEWIHDFTIGEVTTWYSVEFNSTYLYPTHYSVPLGVSTGYFCPSTDCSDPPEYLKLFIDFGLGHFNYQSAYGSNGDF